jgi:hypothetical protein
MLDKIHCYLFDETLPYQWGRFTATQGHFGWVTDNRRDKSEELLVTTNHLGSLIHHPVLSS